VAQGYTKLIDFKVNDRAIKQATERLFKSLDRIEKKLDAIGTKGFTKLGTNLDKATQKADVANKRLSNFGRAVNKLDGYTRAAAFGAAALAGGVDVLGKAMAKPLAEVPLLGGALTKLTAGFGLHSSAIAAAAGAFPPLTAALAAATVGYIAFGKNGVGKVAGWLGTQTKALKTAISQIGTFERKIKMTSKAMEELQRGEGLTGLRTLLAKAVAEQDKLLTSNSGYVQALLKVRALEQDINRELIARQRITDNLTRQEGITSGPGLDGLNKSLREQEAILGRMLSTEIGFEDKVAKVKSIQELITDELRQRELLMGKINIKEEKSASFAERTSKFRERAGDLAQKVRPGGRGFGFTGVERRGLQVGAAAGATMGVSGFMSTQNAIANQVNKLSTIPMPWGKWETGIHMATQSSHGFLGVLNDLGHQLAHVQPEYLAIAAAAYMAFGVDKLPRAIKNVFKAGKATRKTTASLVEFGKTTVQTGAFLKGINMDFKLTSAGAKQLGVDIDTIANGMDRMNRERALAAAKLQRGISTGSGNIQKSGFGTWSAKMDQQEKTRKTFADATRRKELKWANALEASNNRTVEIKGKQLNIEQRINRVMERRQRMAQSSNKQGMFRGGAGGALSSAMIGGGFPLLFGQGGASAVGGGVGGLLGGAIGGGFGFGLSIVGTAIGQWITQMDEFNSQVNAVNADMKALGFNAEFTGKEIKEMAKYLRISKEETMQLFSNYMRFGKEVGTTLMKFYGQDFSNLFAIGKIKDSQSAMEAIVSMSKVLTFEEQAQLIAQVGTVKSEVIQIKLMDLMIEKQYNKNKQLIEEVSLVHQIWYWTKRTAAFLLADDPVSRKLLSGESPAERRLRLLKELDEEMAGLNEATKKALEQILKVENILDGTSDKLSMVNNLYDQIARTVEDGLVNAIEGAIEGTKTLGEVASSVFRQIGRMLLQYGVHAFMGSLPGGVGKFFSGRAEGGPVTGNKSYIVGEKGPELFTPRSSGHITPNHELGGGGGNVTVNVDASGSAVEGDGAEASRLGRMLGAAIQAELIKQRRPGGLLR
jgi:Sec-independent protein translocase protein TatA